ncbi:MAG: PfkB family carbohydrate kinase, partial [Actinomycetes bacterium]
MVTGTVVVVGSLNVDVVVTVPSHPRPGETVLATSLRRLPGGKGANQAVAAARAGAVVRLVGCVGDDADGADYVDRLAAQGVDTSTVRRVVGVPTGTALVTVDDAGENSIVVAPGANARVTADDVRAVVLAPGDVVLVQLEVPLDVVAAAARHATAHAARLVLNLAPFAELPAAVLGAADPVVANEHEAAQLRATPGSLAVTLGARGARWQRGGEVSEVPAPAVDAVDTTGAGDVFAGTLAAAIAAGAEP